MTDPTPENETIGSPQSEPHQTGIIILALISKMTKVPIDIRGIMREYGITSQEPSKEELVRILKNLQFRTSIKVMTLKQMAKYPIPAVIMFPDKTFGLLMKVDIENDQVTFFSGNDKTVHKKSFEEFDELTTGEIIVLKHRVQEMQRAAFGFSWFYKEILTYKRVIGEVLLGSFVVQLFGLVTPLFTQVILDKVIVHHSLSTLDVLGVAFLAIMVFEFLLNITRNYIFTHTANKIDAKLGAKLFRHLFSLPFVYFEGRRVGTIVARVRELDSIRDFITNKSVSVIIDMFFSSVFLIMMLLYSVKLTMIVLGFITLIALMYLCITPIFRERVNEKFEMGAHSSSFLVETITGVQTVKSLSIEGSMQRKWENYLGNYLQSSFNLNTVGNIARATSNLFQKAMTISILYFGVRLVIENQMTIGQLIAFQMFANQLTNPVLRLVNLWNELQQTLLAVDRLGDILNNPVESFSTQAITLPKLNGSLRFDNISFRYNMDLPYVVEKVNFAVAPGAHIGIVGRSGSGKSTLTKLIQRLYIPNDGAIYIDDIDSRHMNPTWLRNHIGVVLQENYLFSGTIRENIAMPRQDAPIELIIQVAKMAGAHEFISELSEGYDTPVGERGSALSGGQKQRIAIARALITDPRILILDEATSALDYESEKIIQQNLKNIKKGRTVFVIAHRLSTVRECDAIIAMDRGKIVEMGTHQQLMAKNGYYKMLASQQDELNAQTV